MYVYHMKKTILILTITIIAFTSCKKEQAARPAPNQCWTCKFALSSLTQKSLPDTVICSEGDPKPRYRIDGEEYMFICRKR